MKNYDKIYEYVKSLEIIDTHEHLEGYEKNRDKKADVLSEYLFHYFSVDLISSGLSKNDFNTVINPEIDIEKRFRLAKPYWEVSKFTGYGRSLRHAVRLIYGIDDICENTIKDLNEQFLKALNNEKHYKKVLKDISKIKISILDGDFDCDKDYFKPAVRIDDLIMPDLEAIHQLELDLNTKIRDFDEYLESVKAKINSLSNSGNNILKSALAYTRSLYFPLTEKAKAEEEYINLLSGGKFQHTVEMKVRGGENLQNFMMHYVLKCAEKHEMVYQFHTGLQEGNGNFLANSNPVLLNNLFALYPAVKFDVFHIGYPYHKEIGALAKMFPNVYIDMCWAHIISPTACINALDEWLDLIAYNKILGFGGDYCFIDGVAGHQFMARENIARTLAKKIDEGVFDYDTAKHVAKSIFFDNPKKLYKLDI